MIPGGDVAVEVASFGVGSETGSWSIGDRVMIDVMMIAKGESWARRWSAVRRNMSWHLC
jgi:NADPH:quinone reductase-like Zn-dependent oxidoreductase